MLLLQQKELCGCDRVKDVESGRWSWTVWVVTWCYHCVLKGSRENLSTEAKGNVRTEARCHSAGFEEGSRSCRWLQKLEKVETYFPWESPETAQPCRHFDFGLNGKRMNIGLFRTAKSVVICYSDQGNERIRRPLLTAVKMESWNMVALHVCGLMEHACLLS